MHGPYSCSEGQQARRLPPLGGSSALNVCQALLQVIYLPLQPGILRGELDVGLFPPVELLVQLAYLQARVVRIPPAQVAGRH